VSKFDWEYYLLLACSLAFVVLGAIFILFLALEALPERTTLIQVRGRVRQHAYLMTPQRPLRLGAVRRDGFGFCTTRPLVGAQPAG
jgi:hypothetical protein